MTTSNTGDERYYTGEPGDLTTEQAAERLHLSAATVRRRIRAGRLYGYRVGRTLRLPPWQFVGEAALPHLPEILAALPEEAHPMTVTGFMTLPSDELDGLSPVDWLATGGNPDPVRLAASTLTVW